MNLLRGSDEFTSPLVRVPVLGGYCYVQPNRVHGAGSREHSSRSALAELVRRYNDMPATDFSVERAGLQSKMRDYAEMIWEAGGETRLAHDTESQALLHVESLARALRERLEKTP